MNRFKGSLPIADLNLLHVFLAICDLNNLTAAGERLGLTQPAISHALRRLRVLLKDPLFVRTPSGMVPTNVAKQLQAPLTRAFLIIEHALQQSTCFEPSIAERTFRLSMSDMAELYFLPSLLTQIAQLAPGVRLEITPVAATNLGYSLRSGIVDLALGFVPDLNCGCVSELLFHDEHACLVRAGHPLSKSHPTAADMGTLRYVVADSDATGHGLDIQQLHARGFKPDLAVKLPHFTIACQIVRHTDLAVIIPRNIAKLLNSAGDFRILPLPFGLPPFAVQLHMHAQFEADPGLAWVRSLIINTFARAES